MDRNEAIRKLEELSALLGELHVANYFLGGSGVQAAGAKSQMVCARAHTIPSIPDALDHLPNIPRLEKSPYAKDEQAVQKFRKMMRICLIAAAVGLVGSLLKIGFLFPLIGLGFTAALVCWVLKHMAEKQYKRDKQGYDVKVAKLDMEMTAFRNALAVYEQQRAAGLEALEAKVARFSTYYDEWKEIEREYMEEKNSFLQKRETLEQQIAAYDFVPAQYHHLVNEIIDLLRSGRADDYKEALNLAIAEEREEQERQARLAEEARRTALEEQRAAAERRHYREMEAQQRAHNEKMERQAAQAEHDRQVAAKKAESDARKAAFQQHADLKNAAFRRCNSCANAGHCNIKFRDAAINCAAFRPR